VTAVFVIIAIATALLEKRPFQFFPELLLLMMWLCYSLVPSIGAQSLDLAYTRMQQMLQIVILALLSANVMMWYGKVAIFSLVYFLSAVLAYIASLAGFGFGIIDESVLQELNASDRIVGTHGNANQFGMLCLTAQLAAVFFVVQTENVYAKLAAGLAIAVLGIAIINTASRTAIVGMIFLMFGLVWVFEVWRIRFMARTIMIIGVFGLIGTAAYLSLDKDDAIRTRIDSYLENEYLMSRYESLLHVFKIDDGSVELSAELTASDEYRTQLMKDAWDAANESPLGLGLGNFSVLATTYAHSNYFEVLATTGFIGLALYIAIYLFMLGRFLTFSRCRGKTTTLIRVFAISVVTLMITDIAHVSYIHKFHWLFFTLAIASIELYGRIIPSQPEANRQSRIFAYGTN
jgi:O-antigen ligase